MTTAAEVFRDYVVDGNPSSGVHQPVKSEIRSLFVDMIVDSLTVDSVIVTDSLSVESGIVTDGAASDISLNVTMKGTGALVVANASGNLFTSSFGAAVFTGGLGADAFKNAVYLGGSAIGVNGNSANTDTPINITLPDNFGITKYRINAIFVSNRGTTASLTTATAGLFTAAGGGGTAIAANQALSTITSNADNVANNIMALTQANLRLSDTTLFFRIGTAQGAATTLDVFIYISPLAS